MHVDKQTTRTCTRRSWECGRNIPERAYVNCLDSPAACVSSTINTTETELQDNRLVVKAIWRVNKVASSSSVREKDHSGPRLMGLFLKSKPQVAVRIQPSFVVQLGRCYTETRRRCKAQQLFVCVFNSSPLWNNIKPSHHPIPHWAGKGGRGGAEAETGLRWPAASRGFRDPSHQLRRDGVPQIWQNEERGP